ncbi:hypothetical protein ACI3PL_32715, partial [Lacticaseibacillus paracasei]
MQKQITDLIASAVAKAGDQLTGLLRVTEATWTPIGTTQTITLSNSNHHTLSLASTTGNPTITL